MKRIWRWCWRSGVVLLIAVIITLAITSIDEPRMNTGALRYEPRVLPATADAYPILARAAERLGKANDIQRDRDVIRSTLSGATWDDAQVSAWLADRAFAIDAIRAQQAFSSAQYPVPANAEAAFSERPYIHHLGWIAALRARQFQRAGDHAAATELVIHCLHAARLLEHARGDRTAFFQALSMQHAAWDVAILLIADPATSSADCTRLGETLAATRPDRDAFVQLIAAEFRTNTLLTEAMRNPAANLPNWRFPPAQSFAHRLPFLYKPNETLNYIVPYFQSLAASIDMPVAKRENRRSSGHEELGFLCDQYDDWINRLGKRLAHDGFTGGLVDQLDKRLGEQTRISLGMTFAALRGYHDAHGGALPATLDEMVPSQLSAVPRDYYTGEALRYSRELRALWSAGEKNLRLEQAGEAVAPNELIIPVRFDGSYAPWPRRDPYASHYRDTPPAENTPDDAPTPSSQP